MFPEQVLLDPLAKQTALSSWWGGRAKLWDYSPTHSTLVVRVEKRGVRGNMHIVCGGCTFIEGPFVWENSHIEICGHGSNPDSGITEVRDSGGRFLLLCQVVSLAENVEPIYQIGG